MMETSTCPGGLIENAAFPRRSLRFNWWHSIGDVAITFFKPDQCLTQTREFEDGEFTIVTGSYDIVLIAGFHYGPILLVLQRRSY